MDDKRGNEKLQGRTQGGNDVFRILAIDNPTVAQTTLTLGRLCTLQVAPKGAAVLRFS